MVSPKERIFQASSFRGELLNFRGVYLSTVLFINQISSGIIHLYQWRGKLDLYELKKTGLGRLFLCQREEKGFREVSGKSSDKITGCECRLCEKLESDEMPRLWNSSEILFMEEILHQLRLVVYSIIDKFFFHPRWWSPDFFHQQNVHKWLYTWKGHLEGQQAYLGDLLIIGANYLLNAPSMWFQHLSWFLVLEMIRVVFALFHWIFKHHFASCFFGTGLSENLGAYAAYVATSWR